jgi:sialic acid synthase SpsE
VAEIGGNHGGDLVLAAKMIIAAEECGFDCVKFQAYQTDLFLHQSSPYYDELKEEELSFKDLAYLSKLAKKLNLYFGLTVFDDQGLDLAVTISCDFIKISSGDLTYYPLIRKAKATGLPLVLSTGAATQAEVDRVLEICPYPAALLQCTSLYPAPEDTINLAVMASWLKKGLRAGLSDHSLSAGTIGAASLLGAVMVEKHFTLDRNLPGGDNSMSLDPSMILGNPFIDFKNQRKWRQQELENSCSKKTRRLAKFKSLKTWGSRIKYIQTGERPELIHRYALAAYDLRCDQLLSPELVIYKRLSPQMIDQGGLLTPDVDLDSLKLNKNKAAQEPIYLDDLTDQSVLSIKNKNLTSVSQSLKSSGLVAYKDLRPWPSTRPALRLALAISHLFERPTSLAREIIKKVDTIEIKKLPEPDWLPGDKRRIFHSGFGLVEKGFIESFDEIYDYLEGNNINYYSCDLGPAAEMYQGNSPVSNVLSREEIERKIKSSLLSVRKRFSGQISVENYNYFDTGLYEHVCQPDFISSVLSENKLGLVLDLAHAAVTAKNFGQKYFSYLKSLPLERITEIHLSKPYLPVKKGKSPADSHRCPGPVEFRTLTRLMELIPDKGQEIFLVIEYYKNKDDLYEVMVKLKLFCDNFF